MFTALDTHGNRINLLADPNLKRGRYTCPGCGGQLIFKKGEVLQAHFAHRSLQDCLAYSENESPQHLELKASLYRWLRQTKAVEIEYAFPEIQQIADLFVFPNLALEIQCSSLSIQRLKDRTRSYHNNGQRVLWLLGEKLWLKDRLTKLQEHFLYFSWNCGFHYWELDLKQKEIRLKYLIHEDLHGKVQYLQRCFPFGEGDLLSIFRFPFQGQALSHLRAKVDPDIEHYVACQLFHRDPKWMKRQAVAYQEGKNLLTYSRDDFYPQLTPVKRQDFCQITTDLNHYYQAFDRYYQEQTDKRQQVVYSPAYYRMK
ncbi:competence protein CoiA family protein [Streptococcus sp. DD13]|uniref:competence protein CoiA family protein n=1 Tax=Streptococcus sp. DD13 TaxID=1777881 RepID=UPI000798226A|nr:competence protein CoiA family protein [Streptococcus sp. DD13]KXT79260.1 Competence protein CoiA [Streptococcus sp. DD13]